MYRYLPSDVGKEDGATYHINVNATLIILHIYPCVRGSILRFFDSWSKVASRELGGPPVAVGGPLSADDDGGLSLAAAVAAAPTGCWLFGLMMSLEPLNDAPKAARGSALSFTGDDESAAITAIGTWPLTKAAPAVAIALLRPMPTSFSVRGQCAKAKARADLRIADATGNGTSQPTTIKQR